MGVDQRDDAQREEDCEGDKNGNLLQEREAEEDGDGALGDGETSCNSFEGQSLELSYPTAGSGGGGGGGAVRSVPGDGVGTAGGQTADVRGRGTGPLREVFSSWVGTNLGTGGGGR